MNLFHSFFFLAFSAVAMVASAPIFAEDVQVTYQEMPRYLGVDATTAKALEHMTPRARKAWYKTYQQARKAELAKVDKALNSLTPQQRLDLFDAAQNGRTVTLRPNNQLPMQGQDTPATQLTPKQQAAVAAAKAKFRGLPAPRTKAVKAMAATPTSPTPMHADKQHLAEIITQDTPTPATAPAPAVVAAAKPVQKEAIAKEIVKETRSERRKRLRQERIAAYKARKARTAEEATEAQKEYLHPFQRNTHWGQRENTDAELNEAM